MPQVPLYRGPAVGARPLQPVYQNTPDVSSGLRVVGQSLTQIGDLADRQVRRDAEAEANKVDTDITTGWLEWDAVHRRKYQGQNAGEYETAAREWWDKARETYGKDVSPLAQQAIGPALARKRAQALGAVANHVGAEKERWADDQAEAAAQTTIDFGVDTGDVTGAAERVRKIAAEKGSRKGWSTEQTQAEQQRLLGTLHLAHITRAVETNPAKAREYYEAHKGEIPAAAQARVEQVLKGEADNQFATQFAAERATKPLSEQLAAAAAIKDPERREKTITQIRNNHAMVQAAQREREQAASDEAWQMVAQGKKVPERILMQLNGRERVQLRDYLTQKAKQDAEGKPVKTDWAVYIAAREKLAAGEKVNLVELTTKVAPAQLEQLLDIQTKTKEPKKLPEVASSEQQISGFARTLDLKKEKLGQFQSAAYDRFNEFFKRTGKEPNYDDRQKILDDLNKEIVTSKGWIWDSKAPAYQAPKDVRDKALGPVVPEKFTVGQVYRDAQTGERAKYLGNNRWEPVK